MAKRRTAERTHDTTPASDEIVTLTEQPPAANSAAEAVSPAAAAAPQSSSDNSESSRPLGPDSPSDALREPGDDTQKSWVKQSIASIIVDPEAGVKFHFDYERHKAAITFNEKPTAETLDLVRPILQQGKFRWESGPISAWEKDIKFTSREQDRREAKKTFYVVANAIREQKGLPARHFGEAMAF
jgi:hypothetical protein